MFGKDKNQNGGMRTGLSCFKNISWETNVFVWINEKI